MTPVTRAFGDDVSLTHISELVTNDPTLGDGPLGIVRDAGIVISNGAVAWVGPSSNLDKATTTRPIDMTGRAVLPGFVDSHSHIIFAGDRSQEFAARMAGQPYAAGGIRTTVEATRNASDDTLRTNARRLIQEMHSSGTTTVEIKSGYGLNVPDEARSVNIAAEFTDEVTFMGAHVVAPEYSEDPEAYVDLVCGPMLQACAENSRWIDVFCDQGAFTEAQARRILVSGIAQGLLPRIHLSQITAGDGISMAVELNCASADHLTHLRDADISALSGSNTVAGLVPAAEFSTRSNYPRARDLIDAGVTIALSPDCNPGSSYTTSMPFCIALAVREMHMTVDEAIFAATQGGAKALRRNDIGNLSLGSSGDLVALNCSSYIHLAYRPGVSLVHSTWKRGTAIYQSPTIEK